MSSRASDLPAGTLVVAGKRAVWQKGHEPGRWYVTGLVLPRGIAEWRVDEALAAGCPVIAPEPRL